MLLASWYLMFFMLQVMKDDRHSLLQQQQIKAKSQLNVTHQYNNILV